MGAAKDFMRMLQQERVGGKQSQEIKEWDCFDQLVEEWKRYFIRRGVNKLKETDIKEIWEDAMNLNGNTPPAKRSGGTISERAYQLWKKHGKGEGPSFGAAMREGLNLAQGGRSRYKT